VTNVYQFSKFDNKAMRGFYNVFLMSSKVGCGFGYEITEIRCQYHIRSSEELTRGNGMSRYKSFPTRLHDKCLESISMSSGMWNILKRHLKALTIDIGACKLFIDSVAIVTKETDIAYTRDNTLRMISRITSHAKDEEAWRREKIKDYTREHIDYLHLKTFGIMFGAGASNDIIRIVQCDNYWQLEWEQR
jgi:hypothetical protein